MLKKILTVSAIGVGMAGLIFVILLGFKSGFTFRQVVQHSLAETLERDLPKPSFIPQDDPDRLNILLLGIRGVEDNNGGLLTDSIVLISIRKSDKKMVLVSLPRDMYTTLPNGTENKINAAYAYGEAWHGNGGGLVWSKRVAEYITGVKVHYAVSIDLVAFGEIVDALEGITITLDKPFEERTQWAGNPDFASTTGAFLLPAGKNILDSESAMFYVRSRFSTSDFDRARRTQQVLKAVADKATSLGFLTNPLKINKILTTLGAHVRTNASERDIQEFIGLLPALNYKGARNIVLDTTPEGLLHHETIRGAYVLLPEGNDFTKVRERVKNVF